MAIKENMVGYITEMAEKGDILHAYPTLDDESHYNTTPSEVRPEKIEVILSLS